MSKQEFAFDVSGSVSLPEGVSKLWASVSMKAYNAAGEHVGSFRVDDTSVIFYPLEDEVDLNLIKDDSSEIPEKDD